MPNRIEDYALLGDCRTAALVSRDGSLDWLCLPRFDSGACFAALLGGPEHGRWVLAPERAPDRVERAYRDGSLVLDTTFHLGDSAVTVTDAMPLGRPYPSIVRLIRGVRGRMRMRTELVLRFDYGSIVPWVRKIDAGIAAIAGPDAVYVRGDVPLRGERMTTVGTVDVAAGQTFELTLAWLPSHLPPPDPIDGRALVDDTVARWHAWTEKCTHHGEYQEAVMRSLVTLAALTDSSTGAIVAAPTTSLPEAARGTRNWDYRYCWLRDATFTLLALAHAGYLDEARAWREWVLRAVAGDPSKLQILYAVDGTRRIVESTIPWLPGFGGAQPVRVGNAAYEQRQLDVFGEVLDSLYQFQRLGLPAEQSGWGLVESLLGCLEDGWEAPDQGIWEVRGPRRQFTHSKVMAWVAFDRGVRLVEELGARGPVERWRGLRARIHEEICRQGYDPDLGTFVQYYGSKRLDASLLLMPLVGFLPPTDARVQGTARAVERHLMRDGLVMRYETHPAIDGLPPGEGVFLPCSFWLADVWALLGRHDDARRLFERLLALRNDVGLLAEEYDPAARRMLGNFPQAFSHVSLVDTALNLSRPAGPAHARASRPSPPASPGSPRPR
jgi:GH15 family glucan-1,4-alpha-glucosidase